MLGLYQTLIRIRADQDAWRGNPLKWIDGPGGLLAFRRGDLTCAINLTDDPSSLTNEGRLAASSDYNGNTFPADSAVRIQGPGEAGVSTPECTTEGVAISARRLPWGDTLSYPDQSSGVDQIRSMMVTLAWPPPSHIV